MEENGSDMLTKALSAEKLDVCRMRIGMTSHPMPECRGILLAKPVPPYGNQTSLEKES